MLMEVIARGKWPSIWQTLEDDVVRPPRFRDGRVQDLLSVLVLKRSIK